MSETTQVASGIVQKMMAKMTQAVQDEIAQAQKPNDPKSDKPSPATPN
jgi:hypothetical protein